MPFLEIACFSENSAINAQVSGADRIELCADGSLGGVTPPLSDIKAVRPRYFFSINVMIRPRGGDFVYSPKEMVRMKTDIHAFAAAGADGFVFGMLTEEGKIDIEACRELVTLVKVTAYTLNKRLTCTFHRAFDKIPAKEMKTALEELIALGFDAVLTSGGAEDALQGKKKLKWLVELAAGKIEIIVGGRVRSNNVAELMRDTGAQWFHSSALVRGHDVANATEIESLKRIVEYGS
ncbi:hypothetical protein WAI453_002434 [Rhynchosporium graminicola]|uniref:Copper homeostasis protein cutC homolog n=1 Tax=Rhynchosporium graminicola TaxID=2792576 RepID=A0A1E1KNI1_9HELO|nr:related to Copper homeostasis protein CutC [Rhynchosporium commune]